MRALVFGASAGVGRALARALGARGYDLVLLARDPADLAAEASHIRLAHGVAVSWLPVDATRPESLTEALAPLAEGEAFDLLAFPLGLAAPDDDGLLPGRQITALVNANLTAAMVAVGLLLPAMLTRGRGDIVGFGSVAAIRGRGSNVAYAAAKRGLESFFESLRHRTHANGLRVQFYRLGYVSTSMSFGQKLPALPKATPEAVAETVVGRLGRDQGMIHFPSYWAVVRAILVAIPWIIYRRLRF